MIVLTNSKDNEISFTELEVAKQYYLNENVTKDIVENSNVNDVERIIKFINAYKKDIIESDSLIMLAYTLNHYTDVLGNGSRFNIREI